MTSGWILLDKPAGISSRHAGRRVARMFGADTFGHLGTLDPFATGLLPIALGAATKMIPYLEEARENVKEYLFGVQFGFATDTLDITGRETARDGCSPQPDAITAFCKNYVGPQFQVPPIYSAVHVGGARAYKLARAGQTPEMAPRKIEIFELENLAPTNQQSETCLGAAQRRRISNQQFRVVCSPGTYVRAIGRDMGQAAGCLATVDMIRRTRTHGFSVKDAITLENLEKIYNNKDDSLHRHLKPVDFGLDDILVQDIDSESAKLFKNGGFIWVAGGQSGLRRVYSDGRFIGIGRIEENALRPKRIIE